MRISELARLCDVKTDTIRYYEKRGLLPEPVRSQMVSGRPGYRKYTEVDTDRVRFIRQCQNLGFSLDEIGQLLNLRYETGGNCAPIVAIAQEKQTEIDQKIELLETMKQQIQDFLVDCSEDDAADGCSFFDRVLESKTSK